MASFTKLALSMDTGYSLFPNIYFGKEHVGGYDDFTFYFSIQEMKDKKLAENGFSTCWSNTDMEDKEKIKIHESNNFRKLE